jgi:hypothetical protein
VSMHFGVKNHVFARSIRKNKPFGVGFRNFPPLEGWKGSASWEGSGGGRHARGRRAAFAGRARRSRQPASAAQGRPPRRGRSRTVGARSNAHLPRPQSSHARRLGGDTHVCAFPSAQGAAEGARKARRRFGSRNQGKGKGKVTDRYISGDEKASVRGRTYWILGFRSTHGIRYDSPDSELTANCHTARDSCIS